MYTHTNIRHFSTCFCHRVDRERDTSVLNVIFDNAIITETVPQTIYAMDKLNPLHQYYVVHVRRQENLNPQA